MASGAKYKAGHLIKKIFMAQWPYEMEMIRLLVALNLGIFMVSATKIEYMIP